MSADHSPGDSYGLLAPCPSPLLSLTPLCPLQVKSGSGDLDVMRLIRKLRVRVLAPEVTYGSHLATHMALGLLFLGSGRYIREGGKGI